jgi:hypothetical protein
VVGDALDLEGLRDFGVLRIVEYKLQISAILVGIRTWCGRTIDGDRSSAVDVGFVGHSPGATVGWQSQDNFVARGSIRQPITRVIVVRDEETKERVTLPVFHLSVHIFVRFPVDEFVEGCRVVGLFGVPLRGVKIEFCC